MKILSSKDVKQISGGSVHWHQRQDGSYSGGGDYLSSLPASSNDKTINTTTGKALGASLGGLIGASTTIPGAGYIGSLAGGALGTVFGQ